MKITDWVKAIDANLSITMGNQSGPWIATIKKDYWYVHFKESLDDCMLSSATGWGTSAEEAVRYLCKSLCTYSHIIFEPIKGQNSQARLTLPIPKILNCSGGLE